MGISVANTTSANTVATSLATASVSPTANTLQLLAVFNGIAAGVTPNQPTVSGCGLTWVVVASFVATDFTIPVRLTLFRALGASPTTGAITVDCAGQTNQISAILDQVSSTDITGTNGSGAVVQNATAHGTTSPLTATLGAFGSTANGTYGAFGLLGSTGITAGSGFTKLVEIDGTSSAAASEWRVDNSTSVSASAAGVIDVFLAVAVEIKAALTPLDDEAGLTFAHRRNW